MKPNPRLDWAHSLWHPPATATDTSGIEMQHPAVIRGWNWWQKIYSSSHLCHLAWAPQSCFLIRLWDFSGIFMCKLNIIVLGKWIGQLGEGFAYLVAQMLTLIKSGNNMNSLNKDTQTQKGFSATASVQYVILLCISTCVLHQLLLLLECHNANHAVILLFFLAPSFNEGLRWLWLQLLSLVSSADCESFYIRVLQND